MTALLAARGQHFPAPYALHAGAEAMGLMAPAHFGLKRAFRQRMLLIAGPLSLSPSTATPPSRGCTLSGFLAAAH